jgi:hypothetical protein
MYFFKSLANGSPCLSVSLPAGGCYEKALGGAVRSAHQPQLSIVYLDTHTPSDAATYGIDVPVRMASE